VKIRGIGLALLVFCFAGGLIAALFTPSLAATLTLPATPSASPATGITASQPSPTAETPTEPAPQPTVVAAGVVVLARDTFQRPDQQFWGSSSDGRSWAGNAQNNPAFSIVKQTGQISGGNGPLSAILNVVSPDAEILINIEVNHFDAEGEINVGGVLRWQDANNWYKVLIDGTNLQLLKDVNGQITSLGTQPFKAADGVVYAIRFRVLGSYLFAKAWPDAQPEPANWMLTVIDTSQVTGVAGIRSRVIPGAVISVTSFLETSVPGTV
jgi:hypothetical protein